MPTFYHQHKFELLGDGDYVTFGSLQRTPCGGGWEWIEHTRWLIPNSQIED